MSLFGHTQFKRKVQKENQQRENAEIARRAECQDEINEILKKYNLAIRARFELVIPPQPVEPPKTNKE
jgi:hypothetical protein|tara:strand:+ start:3164 stop:3367 length:204 start_codon:yes stop_codon:yes gene_type:complete